MSVDLYVDGVCRHARAILVRLLGGLDYWRYGAEELSALARANGIALAMIPGDGRRRCAAGGALDRPGRGAGAARPLLAGGRRRQRDGRAAPYRPARRPRARRGGRAGRPAEAWRLSRRLKPTALRRAPRSSSTAPSCSPTIPLPSMRLPTPSRRGLAATAIFVGSLKDEETAAFVERTLADLRPASSSTPRPSRRSARPAARALDAAACPVLQVVTAGASRGGLGRLDAGALGSRPRHACRSARARRAAPGRRDLLQGRDERGRHHAHRSSPAWRAHRSRRRQGRRPGRASPRPRASSAALP